MKVLIFSDLHLHEWSYAARLESGTNSRLLAQVKALWEMADYCRNQDIRKVVFCGDMFHKHGTLTAPVITSAYSAFSHWFGEWAWKYDTDTFYFLVGNHDMGAGYHCMDWLSQFGHVITGPKILWDNFWGCGYTEDKENLTWMLDRTDGVIFLHQGVSGVKMGSGRVLNEILTPVMVEKSPVKHVFTGHYHKHERVSNKLTVVGSLMQHTWADAGTSHGFLVYETDTDTFEQIPTSAPLFVRYPECGKTGVKNNYVRCENIDEETKKELYLLGALYVDAVPVPREESELPSIKSPTSLTLQEALNHYLRNTPLSTEEKTLLGKLVVKEEIECD
jgi:DNA repair exonuclease SbcCD nuclease subunit